MQVPGQLKYLKRSFRPLLLGIVFALGRAASGEPGDFIRAFENPEPTAGDQFGLSVVAVGEHLLVGAPGDDAGANGAGTAYLFDGATGDLLLTINNPEPGNSDYFGWRAAADGNYIVIAAYFDNAGASDSGTVYLFDATLRGTTSTPLLTINNPTPAADDNFGHSVSIAGDLILVGSPGDDTAAGGAGAAYLFDAALRGTTNTPLLTINNPTPASNEFFGYSAAFLGGDLLVGAPFEGTGASGAGSVYLFDGTLRGTTDLPLLTINNPTPAPSERFGDSVAAVEGNILTGAAQDSTGANFAGSAYLFDGSARGTSSTPLLTINNPSPADSDYFGFPVAPMGGDLLVAAYSDSTGALNDGSVYLFDGAERGMTSVPLLTLTNPAPADNDLLGGALAALGGNIAASVYNDDSAELNAGVVYLFEGPAPPAAARSWEVYQ